MTTYKYLGVVSDEHFTYTQCAETLSKSAGQALGGTISKYRNLNLNYDTYIHLFNAYVVPIVL